MLSEDTVEILFTIKSIHNVKGDWFFYKKKKLWIFECTIFCNL